MCSSDLPKFELVKEADEDSKDWELKLDNAKGKRAKLNDACNHYKVDPSAPKLEEFRKSRDDYGSAYGLLREKTIFLKKKLAETKKALEVLKDKTACKPDVKKGEDTVKAEFDGEVQASSSICQGVTAQR